MVKVCSPSYDLSAKFTETNPKHGGTSHKKRTAPTTHLWLNEPFLFGSGNHLRTSLLLPKDETLTSFIIKKESVRIFSLGPITDL